MHNEGGSRCGRPRREARTAAGSSVTPVTATLSRASSGSPRASLPRLPFLVPRPHHLFLFAICTVLYFAVMQTHHPRHSINTYRSQKQQMLGNQVTKPPPAWRSDARAASGSNSEVGSKILLSRLPADVEENEVEVRPCFVPTRMAHTCLDPDPSLNILCSRRSASH